MMTHDLGTKSIWNCVVDTSRGQFPATPIPHDRSTVDPGVHGNACGKDTYTAPHAEKFIRRVPSAGALSRHFRHQVRLIRGSISILRRAISILRRAISIYRNPVSILRSPISIVRSLISLMQKQLPVDRIRYRRLCVSLPSHDSHVLSSHIITPRVVVVVVGPAETLATGNSDRQSSELGCYGSNQEGLLQDRESDRVTARAGRTRKQLRESRSPRSGGNWLRTQDVSAKSIWNCEVVANVASPVSKEYRGAARPVRPAVSPSACNQTTCKEPRGSHPPRQVTLPSTGSFIARRTGLLRSSISIVRRFKSITRHLNALSKGHSCCASHSRVEVCIDAPGDVRRVNRSPRVAFTRSAGWGQAEEGEHNEAVPVHERCASFGRNPRKWHVFSADVAL